MISLRHKLWLGFGGLLIILLIVSELTFVVLTRYSRAVEQVFRENYNSAVYSQAMLKAIDGLNLRAQNMLWHPSDAPGIDKNQKIQQFEQNLASQFNNITLLHERDHTQQLADLWKSYRGAIDSFDSANEQRRSGLYQTQLLGLHQRMRAEAQWIADNNMANMVSVDGRLKHTLTSVRDALLILVAAGTLAAAAVLAAEGTSIFRPLRALILSARQIEAGDLNFNVSIRSRDELGTLAAAFNAMAAKLRELRQIDHDRLLRTQNTTQLAIDSLSDAVFIVGPAAIVEISNRTARELFGIAPGLGIEELSQKARWLGMLYDSAKRGQVPEPPRGYQSAIQVFDSSGERFLLPHVVPMLSESNSPIGVAFILLDVTRLRAADEAKSNLISVVSHELRTPLTSIRMAISLLTNAKFGGLSPKQTTLVQAAREDADRLNRIIENLLSIGRMESGRAPLALRPMAPATIISQALDALRSGFAEKSISLSVNVDGGLGEVLADPAAISSALTNLLANALKYTPQGGRVEIAASAEEDFIAFTVADSGPGIPPRYAGRIFEKFFRVPGTENSPGAGLGLAIARDVILAHGGILSLCQDVTTGAKFRFTLRRASGQPASNT